MCTISLYQMRIFAVLALSALLVPAHAADKPDKKKSQADYQQGVQADKASHRDEAIAAYTAAVEADSSNAEAWRARAKDYLAAGDRAKALSDFEKAVQVQPAGGENYFARGEFFASTGEPTSTLR